MSKAHPQILLYDAELQNRLQPQSLQIIDNSHMHVGHIGHTSIGASHLSINIVSNQFSGLSRVARHRLVYDILSLWMKIDIHALSINAKTPSEK